jgi:cytoskeletal protein RodZ
MEDERKKLGEMFRDKRHEMGVTMKEVENATSIRSNYLEAIESGVIGESLSIVYLQGFTRQYASFLGMQTDQLVEKFPLFFAGGSEKHDFAYGIGTLEMRGSVNGGVRWLPNLLWAGVAALVIVGAWYFAKMLGLL